MALPDSETITFDADRFERQTLTTRYVRIGLVGLIVLGWLSASIAGLNETIWPFVLLSGGLLAWLAANALSGVTARMALQLSRRVSTEPPTDALLAEVDRTARRFTLYHPVRVMIHHQWATLLHRLHRYADSARLTIAMLSHDHGMDNLTRHRVLMLLADSCIRRGDVFGAYGVLCDLHRSRVDLPTALQMLELQTRYQLMCGDARAMLHALRQKVSMVELLPPAASAAMHRSYAHAARGLGYAHTAKWLDDRAMLLWPDDDSDDVTLQRIVSPVDALGLADRA